MPNNFGQVCSEKAFRAHTVNTFIRARRYPEDFWTFLPVPSRRDAEALDSLKCIVPWYFAKKMLSLPILSLVHAEQYLQSPLQLEHACNLIFDSELFAFHSERMCEILIDEATMVSWGCAKFRVAKQTNAMSFRTQIHTLSSSYLASYSSTGDATRVSCGLVNTGNLYFRSSWIMSSLTWIPISRTHFLVQHPPQVQAQVGRV
jgi:hypothetical protein